MVRCWCSVACIAWRGTRDTAQSHSGGGSSPTETIHASPSVPVRSEVVSDGLLLWSWWNDWSLAYFGDI